MTNDQWDLISNLIHRFDENSDYAFVEQFIQEQNSLPLKLRFKNPSIIDFFTSIMTKTQFVFEKSRDILSLSLHDRTTLLRNTVEYTATIGGIFILHQAKLLDDAFFLKSMEMVFQPTIISFIKRINDQFDTDDTFIKIIFTILSFSTIQYTIYSNSSITNFSNIKQILDIQDTYIELAWRYLLYKYNHEYAVKSFNNFIRSIFTANEGMCIAHEVTWFTQAVHSITQQTEETLSLND